MLLANIQRFGRYNRWANRRLYDACAILPDEAYRARRPSFFGSIHRTLNHILVGDRIWLGRIRGEPPNGLPLDAELYPDFATLRAARESEDDRIRAFADGLSESDLAGVIEYANTSGARFAMPLGLILQHVFNHQTHHRGQVHALLKEAGAEPPALDIVVYLRDPIAPKID